MDNESTLTITVAGRKTINCYIMKYCFGTICCLLITFLNYGQDTSDVKELATGLRADGKIYVVVAVAVTIVVGLVIYLVSLDRKISKLEKHNS
jgi:hypothetical protein